MDIFLKFELLSKGDKSSTQFIIVSMFAVLSECSGSFDIQKN